MKPSKITLTWLAVFALMVVFHGTVDFDPGSGVDSHASNGGCDAYRVRSVPYRLYLPWTGRIAGQ